MRIAKESADELILTEQTVWFGVLCGLAGGGLLVLCLVNGNWKGLLGPAFFGFSALMAWRASRVRFDKSTGTVVLDQLRVFKRTRTRLPFDAVLNIVIESSGGDDPAPCRLVLQTPNGPQPLSSAYSSSYPAHEVLRLAVLKILGRASADGLMQSLRDLIRAGRTIDAVALLRSREKMDLTTARNRIAAMKKEEGSGR